MTPTDDSSRCRRTSAVRLSILAISVMTLLAFARVRENGFVNWDDRQNLLQNDAYRGFGAEQLRWMFTTTHGGHYHPLTWLSFAADYRLWGLSPAGFHLTNVVLHSATAIVFFLVSLRILAIGFRRSGSLPITFGALGAALLFSVHPLRVESVVWATERRDVLSGVWLMLTLLTYLMAVQAESERRRRTMLAISVACYGLSLLSKAVGVTLPVVLILLDIFPLRRFGARPASVFGAAGLSPRGFGGPNAVSVPIQPEDENEKYCSAPGDRAPRRTTRQILWEKAIYLVPATAAAVMAGRAQAGAGAAWSLADHPIGLRIGQAFYGVVFYLWKTVWPAQLAPLYEQRGDASALDGVYVAAGLIVLGVTVLIWMVRQRSPALLIAWCVYALLLAPVVGFVQSGPQVVADRYSYLSCTPWAVLAGGGITWAWSRFGPSGRAVVCAVSIAVIAVLGSLTYAQTAIWKDSETLWTATIQRGGSTGIAHANLAAVLNEDDRFEEACRNAQRALKTLPGNRTAHAELGHCSMELGELARAGKHFRIALEISSNLGRTDSATTLRLAMVKTRLGELNEAERLYRELVQAQPAVTAWRLRLAGFLASRDRALEAVAVLDEALRLDPEQVAVRYQLALLHLQRGDSRAAIATLEDGLRRVPGNVRLGAKLAWILATSVDGDVRDGKRALTIARTAVEDSEARSVAALEALAAALAATGDLDQAAHTVAAVLQGGAETLPEDVTERLESQLDRYQRGEPIRE